MKHDFKNRRRNYFINRKFQRTFILKFCALVIIGSAISGGIIYMLSRSTVTTVFDNLRLTIKSTADFILPSLFLASAIVIALVGFATVAVTLFTSHKVAGPLYRMEKDIDEVTAGSLDKEIKLRQADELKALAASLNNMIRALRVDMREIKRIVEELDRVVVTEDAKNNVKKLKKT